VQSRGVPKDRGERAAVYKRWSWWRLSEGGVALGLRAGGIPQSRGAGEGSIVQSGAPASSRRDRLAGPEPLRLARTPQEHRFPPEGTLMPVRGASLVCGAHGAAARVQRDPGSRSRWRRIWKRRPVRRKDPTQDLQSEALAAATAEYRRLNPSAHYDRLAYQARSIG
jgi:hypothetical protein